MSENSKRDLLRKSFQRSDIFNNTLHKLMVGIMPNYELIEKVEAIEGIPESCEFLSGLGSTCLEYKAYEEAVIIYRKLIAINSKKAVYWNGLGLALLSLRNFSSALGAFKKATEINPKNDNFWYNLSLTYSKFNNLIESEKALQKALELNPEDKFIQSAMKKLKQMQGKKTKLDRISQIVGIGAILLSISFIFDIGIIDINTPLDPICFLTYFITVCYVFDFLSGTSKNVGTYGSTSSTDPLFNQSVRDENLREHIRQHDSMVQQQQQQQMNQFNNPP